MYASKITAVFIAGIAAASLALAVSPAAAQTTPANPPVTAKKKPTRVAVASRPPARVTVQRRSFLDPGTETKARDEHYQDYAFPPGVSGSSYLNDYNITFSRSPLPTCFDLPGFCR